MMGFSTRRVGVPTPVGAVGRMPAPPRRPGWPFHLPHVFWRGTRDRVTRQRILGRRFLPGALRYRAVPKVNEGDVQRAEEALSPRGSLGADPGKALDPMQSIRKLAEAYVNVEPLVDFLGNHPIITVALLGTLLMVGGAAGAFVGLELQKRYR